MHQQLAQLQGLGTRDLVHAAPAVVDAEGGQATNALPRRERLVPLSAIHLCEAHAFEGPAELVQFLVHQLAGAAPLRVEVHHNQ